jgi:hypothetical protein
LSYAGAKSAAGIRRGDFDRNLHGEMVARGPDPRALQWNRLARFVHDRNSHEVLISDHAARRIEVDPARPRNTDLNPCMGVAAGDTSSSPSARRRYPDANSFAFTRLLFDVCYRSSSKR